MSSPETKVHYNCATHELYSKLRPVSTLTEAVRLMDVGVGDRSTLSPCNILPSATSLGKLFTTPM